MEILDSGHEYLIDIYDSYNGKKKPIIFMKRLGSEYPGNTYQSHSGTNCQELIRILIDRCKYLNNQIPCIETKLIIHHLREALRLFENRALDRKSLPPIIWPLEIENLPPCKICGHIYPHTCKGI